MEAGKGSTGTKRCARAWSSSRETCSSANAAIVRNRAAFGTEHPRASIESQAVAADGSTKQFPATVRIDTPVELDYYRNGGILQTVLRKLLTT